MQIHASPKLTVRWYECKFRKTKTFHKKNIEKIVLLRAYLDNQQNSKTNILNVKFQTAP